LRGETFTLSSARSSVRFYKSRVSYYNYTVGLDIDTRAYFTAATMMDEKLAILTLFCTMHLPTKKLTSIAIWGKYNYFKLNQILSVRVNSLWNKFYILVEITRTYKTLTYCFIPLSHFLRDRMICVMLHLVNYSYITFSLEVKVRREIMKFAGNGATSLLGTKPNNKVYSNTITMLLRRCYLSNKGKLDRDMSVGFLFLTPELLQFLVKAWW
jgi:hypothetical protein